MEHFFRRDSQQKQAGINPNTLDTLSRERREDGIEISAERKHEFVAQSLGVSLREEYARILAEMTPEEKQQYSARGENDVMRQWMINRGLRNRAVEDINDIPILGPLLKVFPSLRRIAIERKYDQTIHEFNGFRDRAINPQNQQDIQLGLALNGVDMGLGTSALYRGGNITQEHIQAASLERESRMNLTTPMLVVDINPVINRNRFNYIPYAATEGASN